MSEPIIHSLEGLLRHIAEATPDAWYPADFARAHQVERDSLDPFLDDLRMAGLVRLTDWQQGRGQGYAVTDAGMQVLASSRDLASLRRGVAPRKEIKHEPSPEESAFEHGETVRAAFFSDAQPVVTRYLIMANVMVFAAGAYFAMQAGVFDKYLMPMNLNVVDQEKLGQVYYDIGAMNAYTIAQGKWWTTLTTCFDHAGVFHIGMNMYALWVLGTISEKLWGRWRYLVLYLLAGFGGSCVALMNTLAFTIGASGAVCGLLGGLATWFLLNRHHLPPQLVSMFGRNLVINLVLITFISFLPRVSAAAHFGGAGAGAAAAFLLHFQRFGARPQRLAAVLGLFLLPVILVGVVLKVTSNDTRWLKLRVLVQEEDIAEATRALQLAYNEGVLPLLKQPADKRDQAEVNKSMAELESACARLRKLEARWQQPPWFANPDGDAVRVKGLELLQSSTHVCELARNVLERGADKQVDHESLDKEVKLWTEKQRAYQEMVGRFMR